MRQKTNNFDYMRRNIILAENYHLAVKTMKDQSIVDRDLKQVIFAARKKVID